MTKPITQSRRQPWSAMALLFLRQSGMSPFHPRCEAGTEDLPVALELQPNRRKPLLDVLQQHSQLPLVGAENREVVHLSNIMAHAVLLLMDQQVKRLQRQVQKPCGEERTDQHAMLHDGIAQPQRLVILEHALERLDNIRRIQFLKAVVNITLNGILRALRVILHPLLQNFHAVGVSSPGDARDAVFVHAPHNVRDDRLHDRVVNILVGP